MNLAGTKVFVGLSGGVDSAVTAALLARAGARVTGVFIKGWYPEGLPCTWAADRRDAMRVAARLRIPFATLDASDEYKRGVLEYLVREYKAGRTPNPDVMCNREVKFGAFYRFGVDHGADFIATGHYARLENGSLLRGSDPAKDQSYFLWAVPQEALARTLFPLGGMRKAEVRGVARRLDLPVAGKPDSQGICFLGPVSVAEYLRAEFGEEEGPALDSAGSVVGRHDGALLHTLGERIALRDAREAGPWYVLAKDLAENALIVAKERMPAPAQSSDISFESANWLQKPEETLIAQYRYHGPRIRGRIMLDVRRPTPSSKMLPSSMDVGRQTSHIFEALEPLPEPPAPGQSIVFYKSDRLVGGGIITE